ncbi:MAG: GNAT family N-acetyltransferase [Paracoccaceae bacterium]|nr:GNAT family N-acetyltransferase [Paracoccaceae bacterium]
MTDALTLRAATPGDLAELDLLFQRSYTRLLKADYPPSVLVTAVPIIARAQPALLASGTFFVVENGDAIVGAGGWSMQAPGARPGARGVGHIRHVATDPDVLRRGVGRMLMEHILLHAKASGIAQMKCQSTRTAVPFYSAMGFETLGEVVVPLRGGIDFPAVSVQRML